MLGVLIGTGVAMCVLRMVILVYTPNAQLNQPRHHVVSHLDVTSAVSRAPVLHVHHCVELSIRSVCVIRKPCVNLPCTRATFRFLADLGEFTRFWCDFHV